MKRMNQLVGTISGLFRPMPACSRFEMDPDEIHRLRISMLGRI